MTRRAGLLALTAVTGAAAVALSPPSFAARSHPYPGTATLIVTEQGCGGPPPGQCSPQRHVKVSATKTSRPYKGEVASGSTNRHGRVVFRLRPGHWRVVVDNGLRKRSKRVVLCSHMATRVHFRLDNGIP